MFSKGNRTDFCEPFRFAFVASHQSPQMDFCCLEAKSGFYCHTPEKATPTAVGVTTTQAAERRGGASYLDAWQSQMPPCFSKVRRISSLLPN